MMDERVHRFIATFLATSIAFLVGAFLMRRGYLTSSPRSSQRSETRAD